MVRRGKAGSLKPEKEKKRNGQRIFPVVFTKRSQEETGTGSGSERSLS
jgi:hypothetical protein